MATVSVLPVSTFAPIVDSLSDAVVIIDSSNTILYWNKSAEITFGYSEGEILGQSLSVVVPIEGLPLSKTGEHPDNWKFELLGMGKAGWGTPLQISCIHLNSRQRLNALIITDVTDQKTGERRLKRSQELGHVGTWERDIPTGMLYWSDETFRICGIEPREHFTTTEFLENHVHPDDVETVQAAMACANVGQVYDLHYRIVRPDGAVRWVHTQGELDLVGQTPRRIVGCMKDVTLYQQSVEELKRSKDNLKRAQSIAKMGHWDWDIRRSILFFSDAIYDITGQDPNGLNPTFEAALRLVHPQDRMFLHESINQALLGKELDVEFRFLRKEGDVGVIHLLGTVLHDRDGEPIRLFGTCQDLTEKRKTEEILVRSEKLAVVGQLAAGFAHEIRNPLTALKGFTQLLHAKSGDSDKRYYEIMLSEMGRISNIVDELLLLAKPQAYEMRPVAIEALLRDVIELMGPQATIQDTEIFADLSQASWVNCEPNQLKQVFVNVIKNGIEAMPDGGILTVRVQRGDFNLRVEFKDQGLGIPQETLSKLGEPFYTTKDGGTGLGLMVSQKILATHKGQMRISSEVGSGTTVCIELPMASL